jgi:hypothetical protein
MNTECPSFKIALPKVLWVYLPIAICIYPYVLHVPHLNWEEGLYREFGLIENSTLVMLAVAVYYGLRLCWRADNPYQRTWFIILTVGTFYFLGEELSWGYHFFNWHTSDAWNAINAQDETNLHNLRGMYHVLLDRLPRELLSIASLVGGFFVPMYFMKRGSTFDSRSFNHWIWPSYVCGITGLLANSIALPGKIAHGLHKQLPPFFRVDTGEPKEALLALFILLYMIGSAKYFSQTTAWQSDATNTDSVNAPS